jgi:hypothetical protein
MLLTLLFVAGVCACLIFVLLMLTLDSDITTSYYDKFGDRLEHFFAGKVSCSKKCAFLTCFLKSRLCLLICVFSGS